MKSFEEIQDTLGQLPNYPKIYLLGSTGAGKTSIVRAILDTATEAFPTTLQTRTTVAPTEYLIDNTLPFKSTFIFKTKENIVNLILDIFISSIIKGLSFIEDNKEFSLLSYLEETPDERFRLKYLVSSEFLLKIENEIINNIIPKLDLPINSEEIFIPETIFSEIDTLINLTLDEINNMVQKICPNYKLFSDELYIIDNEYNKKEFILRNKALLKSELDSISPIIEYARIEGNILADWLPSEYKFILIDGEGIGHNLKEIKSSLSTRHLDFFNFSDSILLLEESYNPFITGGKNAIETIFLNGYSKKFKLIFSKVDKLEVKDYKSALNRRLLNVENALKDSSIQFNLNKNQKYYLSNLHNRINEATQKEINRIFKNIIDDFSSKKDTPLELEYDFETLCSSLDTTEFLYKWSNLIKKEHWSIIKAFSKRMLLGEGEYRYLKPILDYHTIIMQDINSFLQIPNQLNSEIYYAQNQIKQKFSTNLLTYIRDKFMNEHYFNWESALKENGVGSVGRRRNKIYDIFNTIIPQENNRNDFVNLKNIIKKYLIDAGVKEVSATLKVYIKRIKIDKIYGSRDIEWELTPNTNILIGKNGSGKSTILSLLYAQFSNKIDILKRFKNPNIQICITKEYENGTIRDILLEDNTYLENLDIVLIDTFDIIANSIIECKENCEREQSPLDIELLKLMPKFDAYQIKLNKIFEDRNSDNEREIKRILNDIGNGKIDEAGKIQSLTNNKNIVSKEVYQPLNDFREVIDSMFKDTDKKINLEAIEKSFSISSSDKELEPIELSSGEKQVMIVFLTILLKENKPYILMMDEPENSLHSQWQINFVDNIRTLNQNIQIIIATHNPLLMLDREANEIGKISIDSNTIDTNGDGTKYLDVSATLLNYPKVNSLVGKKMRDEIAELFTLKTQNKLLIEEENRVNELEVKLGKTVASNFIYDRYYLHFLKFINENKHINFDKLIEISDEEMNELLGEFKDLFND